MAQFDRSTHRVVNGLKWAATSATEAWGKPRRLKGAKAKGITYQNHVCRLLQRKFSLAQDLTEPPNEGLYVGQWLQFIDAKGRGMAQPDAYLVRPQAIILFEVKLTQCKSGLLQMGQLYRPLLRQIYDKPVIGVLVCKNLIYSPGQWEISGPEQVLENTSEDIFTWHCLR